MDTMSWFDATGFANLAKTALKEAQKTIDKALDIQEENGRRPQMTLPGGEVPVWESDSVPRSESEPELSTTHRHDPNSSLWGSFTGSFFENPKSQGAVTGSNEPNRPTNFISNQPKKSSAVFQPEPLSYTEIDMSKTPPPTDSEALSPVNVREEVLNFSPVVYRKKEPRNYSNRLSAISSESDRRSSSSVEVLGSCTPDSEAQPSLSSSSSVARLRQSGSFESVEVLTSPSSVEVISSPSCEHKYSSDSISPVPESEVEEASMGEDSYTETLTSTVLDIAKDVMLKSTSSLDTSFTEPPKEGVSSDYEAAAMSSCEEGTLMASSGEETVIHTVSSTSCLKTLLADAMTENRDNSPISSESRSDLVKVGSSGHTSGDELETATSSDIEIISSPTPNGDSSSTASRYSPARGKMVLVSSIMKPLSTAKGHQRELSEGSSGGSDEHSEVDKLLKRIAEMTEILEVREAKLIDLSRMNGELQESNNNLQSQLEARMQKQDVSEVSEEFTQRLAALERKFQQAIRDKEILRKELEQSKVAAALAEEAAEKDQVIKDLRAEGEKLSKQQLTLNNIIKKLRVSERENQKTIISLKEQLEECSQEVDRSKKALSAKQDVERSQIEAVHQLTRTNQRLEAQVTSLTAHQDSLTSTIVSLQREVTESKEQCSELQVRLAEARRAAEVELRKQTEAEWGEAAEQRDQLHATVQQLREKLDQQSDLHERQVQELWREQTELVRRLEAGGAAAEDLAQSVSAATQPLVRQIDALTASHAQAQAAWERQERRLLQQIGELESRMTRLADSERAARESLVAGNSRCSALESQLASTLAQLQETTQNLRTSEQECTRLKDKCQEMENAMRTASAEGERLKTSLEQQLAVERAALEAERRKAIAVQEQMIKVSQNTSPPTTPCSSPTLSMGRLSVTDSLASNLWPNYAEDGVETGSACGRMPPVVYGHTTSVLEGLQAQLKQREGEVQQLQWELSRREVERAALNNELATLTARVEAQEIQLAELAKLQTEYDALLLLYGEKLEESQELRMDLQDVKEMYKAQIEQLLKKEPSP